MKWSEAADVIATIAPGVGAAVAGPAGGAVGRIIASILGVEPNPDEVSKAIASDPQAAIKLKQIEANLETISIEAHTERMTQVNETMRAELDAKSPLKSGWRAMTGWTFSVSCAGVMSSIVYGLFQPGADAAELLSNALIVFGIMAAVLGIDITRAGRERMAAMGQRPDTLMDALKKRVAMK